MVARGQGRTSSLLRREEQIRSPAGIALQATGAAPLTRMPHCLRGVLFPVPSWHGYQLETLLLPKPV